MNIALCGTHSTGKTTLAKLLIKRKRFFDYTLLINTTRSMQKKGFKINKNQDKNSQSFLLINKFNELISNRKYISDRSLVDGLAYAIINKTYTKNELLIIENLVNISTSIVDYIFYIPINTKLEKDGVRINSEKYRRKVDKQIKILGKEYKNFIMLKPDSIEGYVGQILKIVE